MADDAPAEALPGTVGGSGALTPLMWMDPVTENPAVGAVEIRELYNTTGDAHPMHVHEVKLQVVDRQPIAVDEAARTIEVPGPCEGGTAVDRRVRRPLEAGGRAPDWVAIPDIDPVGSPVRSSPSDRNAGHDRSCGPCPGCRAFGQRVTDAI